MRENFAQGRAEVDDRPVGATVSIGVVHCEGAVLDVPELLAQADQALYFAKEHGRNRVEVPRSICCSRRLPGDSRPRASSADAVASISAKTAA